jgi:hypothetical protein
MTQTEQGRRHHHRHQRQHALTVAATVLRAVVVGAVVAVGRVCDSNTTSDKPEVTTQARQRRTGRSDRSPRGALLSELPPEERPASHHRDAHTETAAHTLARRTHWHANSDATSVALTTPQRPATLHLPRQLKGLMGRRPPGTTTQACTDAHRSTSGTAPTTPYQQTLVAPSPPAQGDPTASAGTGTRHRGRGSRRKHRSRLHHQRHIISRSSDPDPQEAHRVRS